MATITKWTSIVCGDQNDDDDDDDDDDNDDHDEYEYNTDESVGCV